MHPSLVAHTPSPLRQLARPRPPGERDLLIQTARTVHAAGEHAIAARTAIADMRAELALLLGRMDGLLGDALRIGEVKGAVQAARARPLANQATKQTQRRKR